MAVASVTSADDGNAIDAVTRGVLDDITVIFGSAAAKAHPCQGSGSIASRVRKPLFTVGIIAATVGTGVFVGNNGQPVANQIPIASVQKSLVSVTRPPIVPVPMTSEAAVSSAPPLPVSGAEIATKPLIRTIPVLAKPFDAQKPSKQPAASKRVRDVRLETPQPIVDQPVTLVAPRATVDCVERSGRCYGARIAAAEQTLAAAYQRALSAGVRPKTLREYRPETERARRSAITDPEQALQLYGLITSDFEALAREPTMPTN